MPISVGLACRDGRRYYAVNKDMDQERVYADPWLRENVVPLLPAAPTFLGPQAWLDIYHRDVRPLRRIANDVEQFFDQTRRARIVTWFGSYDFVRLMQLWGPMKNRPGNVPGHPFELRQYAEMLEAPELPRQTTAKHHAGNDADWNLVVKNWLDSLAVSKMT